MEGGAEGGEEIIGSVMEKKRKRKGLVSYSI